jgi:hypothetical protein
VPAPIWEFPPILALYDPEAPARDDTQSLAYEDARNQGETGSAAVAMLDRDGSAELHGKRRSVVVARGAAHPVLVLAPAFRCRSMSAAAPRRWVA